MDHELARLLRFLDRGRLSRDAIVMVVGDHGESLGDHGESSHGVLLYDSPMRVPLVVRGPDEGGRHVRGLASLVDVMPTLLELSGGAAPDGIDGISLRMALTGHIQDRHLFEETHLPANSFGWESRRRASNRRYGSAPGSEATGMAIRM